MLSMLSVLRQHAWSAGGQKLHTDLLQQFWGPFHSLVDSSADISVRDVITALDKALGSHLFLPQVTHPHAQANLTCSAVLTVGGMICVHV